MIYKVRIETGGVGYLNLKAATLARDGIYRVFLTRKAACANTRNPFNYDWYYGRSLSVQKTVYNQREAS